VPRSKLDTKLDTKLDVLHAELRRLERVVVAFSGGADSAFLAFEARQVLGANATAVTAVSPSLAGDEEADCRALASEWDLSWTPVVTHEMERAAYRINDSDRCYHCKAELMDVVGPIADANSATVVLGVNVGTSGDHRPVNAAVNTVPRSHSSGRIREADVREASRLLGLRTWDKRRRRASPAVPYGTGSPWRC
jgi:uncharacterized protein